MANGRGRWREGEGYLQVGKKCYVYICKLNAKADFSLVFDKTDDGFK